MAKGKLRGEWARAYRGHVRNKDYLAAATTIQSRIDSCSSLSIWREPRHPRKMARAIAAVAGSMCYDGALIVRDYHSASYETQAHALRASYALARISLVRAFIKATSPEILGDSVIRQRLEKAAGYVIDRTGADRKILADQIKAAIS